MGIRTRLTADSIIVRNSDLLTAEVDGEVIAMSVERGACYGLNRVGSRLWTLIENPRTIDSICKQLTSEFDVSDSICREEVSALVERLDQESLITITTGS